MAAPAPAAQAAPLLSQGAGWGHPGRLHPGQQPSLPGSPTGIAEVLSSWLEKKSGLGFRGRSRSSGANRESSELRF